MTGTHLKAAAGTAVVLLALAAAAGGTRAQAAPAGIQLASAVDAHGVGYYYPRPQTSESYRSDAATLADSSRERRIGFVTGMTQQMLSNPYPPTFAMFAKGDDAEKMIIVSLTDDGYNTLYRARALFAMLTAIARTTPFFRDNKVDDVFNFFDLCKLLGFTQLTWTDGKQLAHQVQIK